MKLPKAYQKVEVLVGDQWLPATFHCADFVSNPDNPSDDELWWMDYFRLESGQTIPDDICSGDELPPWKPR